VSSATNIPSFARAGWLESILAPLSTQSIKIHPANFRAEDKIPLVFEKHRQEFNGHFALKKHPEFKNKKESLREQKAPSF